MLFGVYLLGNIKHKNHDAVNSSIGINAAQIKLILSAIFLGTQISMSLCLCFFQRQPNILLAVNGQKIFSDTRNSCAKQCRRIDADDPTHAVQKDKSLFHVAGDLVKLILLAH